MIKYHVFFGFLYPKSIYNWVGPDSIDNYGLDYEEKPKRHRESQYRINLRNEKDGFYEHLEQSILKDGCLNPILVNCGRINPNMQRCLPKKVVDTNFIVCHFIGGSRLYIAQKHDIKIPCIISDFTGIFSNYEELKNTREIKSKFYDQSIKVKYEKYGLNATVPRT